MVTIVYRLFIYLHQLLYPGGESSEDSEVRQQRRRHLHLRPGAVRQTVYRVCREGHRGQLDRLVSTAECRTSD